MRCIVTKSILDGNLTSSFSKCWTDLFVSPLYFVYTFGYCSSEYAISGITMEMRSWSPRWLPLATSPSLPTQLLLPLWGIPSKVSISIITIVSQRTYRRWKNLAALQTCLVWSSFACCTNHDRVKLVLENDWLGKVLHPVSAWYWPCETILKKVSVKITRGISHYFRYCLIL